jgi:hypothetical protein
MNVMEWGRLEDTWVLGFTADWWPWTIATVTNWGSAVSWEAVMIDEDGGSRMSVGWFQTEDRAKVAVEALLSSIEGGRSVTFADDHGYVTQVEMEAKVTKFGPARLLV